MTSSVQRDIARLRQLPRKLAVSPEEERMIRENFEKTGRLRPAQVEMLVEAMREGALVSGASVGVGKTLVTACLPAVLGHEASDSMLIAPASLLEKTVKEYEEYKEHFDIDPPARMLSYASISRVAGFRELTDNPPGLIIFDEAHRIGFRSSRARRLSAIIEKNSIRCCALSGTLDRQTYDLQAYIFALCLGMDSPLPVSGKGIYQLGLALNDPKDFPMRKQPWMHSKTARKMVEGIVGVLPPRAFRTEGRRRLASFIRLSPGVYYPDGGSADVPIHIKPMDVLRKPNRLVAEVLENLEERWRLPDGQEIITAAHMADLRKQLRLGFYMEHVWPGGRIDHEWMEARKDWAGLARSTINAGSRYTSEGELLTAIQESNYGSYPLRRAAENWLMVKNRPGPKSEVRWLDKSILRKVAEYAQDEYEAGRPVLVWVHHTAPLDLVDSFGLKNVRSVWGGDVIPDGPDPPSLFLSIGANREGKNLQGGFADNKGWAYNLILDYQPTPYVHEQMLGRTHRSGQTRPVYVIYNVSPPFDRSFETLVRKTKVLADKKGDQKLLLGLDDLI